MTMNPMQRKANMYLLIGVLVTLLITGSIIAVLAMQYIKLNNKIKEEEASMKTVAILTSDVGSGEQIQSVKTVRVPKDAAPSNAFSSTAIEEGTYSKINLKKGTIITDEMIYTEENKTTDDVRIQEYNMIELPTQIQDGQFIDIRLRLPNGTDYIVISKKKVNIPTINGVDSTNTIKLNVSEDEIMLMSNAIVESYWSEGNVLYATTYVEPGIQGQAEPTYMPNESVRNAIAMDPNIVEVAKTALSARFNRSSDGVGFYNVVRSHINSSYTEDSMDDLIDKVKDEVTRAKEERQVYLDALGN